MKKYWSFVLILLFVTTLSYSQVSKGGKPISWSLDISQLKSLKIIKIEPPQNKRNRTKKVQKYGSFKFAEVIDFNKSIYDIGEKKVLDNDDNLWLLHIKSEGAYSLNINFSRFLLPEGAEMYIYTPNKKHKMGAFTYNNNKEYGSLAVAPLQGDEIIIEYYEPKDVDFKGELTIGTVNYDYLNIFGEKDGQFGKSAYCNIDINCVEGNDWNKQKRSVCRMIIDGSTLCTGALVNNTDNNQEPYILSANHCVNTQELAHSTVFVFNYESPICGGGDGIVSQSISGADLIATKNKNNGYLDFTLLKLSKNVPLDYKPYFAGWDISENTPQKSTCIHHPVGDVKKISLDFDSADRSSYSDWGYDDNSFWRINHWDKGTTEGGSSGSPIFDQNKHIVGTLTGGFASCSVDSCDYFQMLASSYDSYTPDSLQLKHWLNPNNLNITKLEGYDTYTGDDYVKDTTLIRHWKDGDKLALYLASNNGSAENGYVSGNNKYGDKAKAEFFNIDEFNGKDAITGAFIAFGYAKGRDNEFITIQVIEDNNNTPSTTILGDAKISLKEVKENADKDYNYFKFEPPVKVNGSVYLSVILPQYLGDTIAIMTTEESKINTAWELNSSNIWNNYEDSWGVSVSHLMALEIGSFTDIKDGCTVKNSIIIYPNPIEDNINIDFQTKTYKKVDILIQDTYGRVIYSKSYNNIALININTSNLKTGFYVLTIVTDENILNKKIIKK